MRFRNAIRATSSLAVLAVVALAGQAYAQETAQAPPPEEDDPTTVDQIIVTAQKREQRLQDVPIVVTVVGEQLIEDAGVRDIKDLTVLTPGLLVTSTSNETVTTARVRGVGTVGDNPGLESSVGVVIDGVYRPRNGVGFGDLGEVERIEILKGPQGTLFGKNTSAGVISVVTKDPEFQFGAEAELTAGNYGALGAAASVTGPLFGDTAAGRLYVARRERDGFYNTNVRAPRTLNEDADQDFYTLRGQLLFVPSDTVSVKLIGDFTERDENCCLGVNLVRGPTQALLDALVAGRATSNPPQPFDRLTYANRSTEQLIEDQGLSGQVDWDTPWFGGATLTSITAWRNWQTVNGQDSDFSTVDLLYRPADGSFSREFDQVSQEVRLAGSSGRLNWLIGGFYAGEELNSNESLLQGTQLEPYLGLLFTGGASAMGLSIFTGLPSNYTPGQGQTDRYHQESNSFALFTNNSFEVTDQLELTLGLRWTSEEKELRSFYRSTYDGRACAASRTRAAFINAALGASAPLYFGYVCAAFGDPAFTNADTRQTRDESEWSGTAKAQYRINEDAMTYLSYARGYKAGGFNLDRSRFNPLVSSLNPDTSFPAEFVDSFELGAKTDWFANSLLLNAAIFHQTFENFQLNTFTGISFVVTSVPEVVSRGVDADFVWLTPVDGLSMQGGITYAETQYGEDRPAAALFQPGGASFRLPGSRVSFAPLWSGSLSTTFERDVFANLLFRASGSARYTSSYNTGSDLLPSKVQDQLLLFNGRVSLGSQDKRWALELWGQNLTDEDYLQVAFDATLQFQAVNAFLGAPRTFGVTLRLQH